ncbi:MAG: hypothetical protein JJ966_04970 [Balneolaceae bacterium]|nr:hypothetical protein [Balneolaceae bacterium]
MIPLIIKKKSEKIEVNILVDTNIIIYHTNGDSNLEQILDGNTIFVSDITEMEIFSYPNLKK